MIAEPLMLWMFLGSLVQIWRNHHGLEICDLLCQCQSRIGHWSVLLLCVVWRWVVSDLMLCGCSTPLTPTPSFFFSLFISWCVVVACVSAADSKLSSSLDVHARLHFFFHQSGALPSHPPPASQHLSLVWPDLPHTEHLGLGLDQVLDLAIIVVSPVCV